MQPEPTNLPEVNDAEQPYDAKDLHTVLAKGRSVVQDLKKWASGLTEDQAITPMDIRIRIQQSAEYLRVKNFLGEHLLLHVEESEYKQEDIPSIVEKSLLKIEANSLYNLVTHALYLIVRKSMYPVEPKTEQSEMVADSEQNDNISSIENLTLRKLDPELIMAEADRLGIIFYNESIGLYEQLETDLTANGTIANFPEQILWETKLLNVAYMAQLEVHNNENYGRYNISASWNTINTFQTALRIFASAINSTFRDLEAKNEGMTVSQFRDIESQYIAHFTTQAGAHVANAVTNRERAISTDGLFYQLDAQIIDDYGEDVRTKCIAFFDTLFMEIYRDFRNHIWRLSLEGQNPEN